MNYTSPYPNYMNRYSYMPQYQMPMQQPQMGVRYDLPVQGMKFLTADEIKAYIVMPNTTEMLIDKANKVAYIKSADQMGQSTTRKYKFEELIGEDENIEIKPPIDYLSKEEANETLTKLNERLDKLEKRIKVNEIMGDK